MNSPPSRSLVLLRSAMRISVLIMLAGSAFAQSDKRKVPLKLPVICAFKVERNRTELVFCGPPFVRYSYENSHEPVVCVDGSYRDPDTVTHANSFDLPLDPPYRISITEEIVKTPRGSKPRLEAGDFCLYLTKAGESGSQISGVLPTFMAGTLPIQCYFHIDHDVIREMACVSGASTGRPGIYREPQVDLPKASHFPKRVKQ